MTRCSKYRKHVFVCTVCFSIFFFKNITLYHIQFFLAACCAAEQQQNLLEVSCCSNVIDSVLCYRLWESRADSFWTVIFSLIVVFAILGNCTVIWIVIGKRCLEKLHRIWILIGNRYLKMTAPSSGLWLGKRYLKKLHRHLARCRGKCTVIRIIIFS